MDASVAMPMRARAPEPAEIDSIKGATRYRADIDGLRAVAALAVVRGGPSHNF